MASVLRSVGDGIYLGQIPAPTAANLWCQDMTKSHFLELADKAGATIHVREADKDSAAYATLSFPIGADLLPGSPLTYYATCRQVNDKARLEYAAHNADCLADAEGAQQ